MDVPPTQNGMKRKRDHDSETLDRETKRKRKRERRKERKARTEQSESHVFTAHTDSALVNPQAEESKATVPVEKHEAPDLIEIAFDVPAGKRRKSKKKTRKSLEPEANLSSRRPRSKPSLSPSLELSVDGYNGTEQPQPKKRKKQRRKNQLQFLRKPNTEPAHGHDEPKRSQSPARRDEGADISNGLNDRGNEAAAFSEMRNKKPRKQKDSRSKALQPADNTIILLASGAGAYEEARDPATAWTVSKPVAGKLLEAPAQFSSDERSLLFSAETVMFIGAIGKSLVEHTFETPQNASITSFAYLNDSDAASRTVCLGLSSGSVLSWHRKKGSRLLSKGKDRPICALATTASMAGVDSCLIFAVERGHKHSEITVRSSRADGSQPVRILKQQAAIQALKVTRSGRILIAATPQCIFIGALAKPLDLSKILLHDLQYEWHEVQCKQPPSCFDLRLAEPPEVDARNIERHSILPQVGVHDRLDVAYGGLSGCIYMYSNILHSLGAFDRSPSAPGRKKLASREMHWHREPVGALAFSPDGNYLISGGRETVLVLWQLDTGRKTYLPHLESPIQSLSISPSGSMYAVGTADNSIIVLSTAELRPIAHFASLQSPSTASLVDQRLLLPTDKTIASYLNGAAATGVASAVNPSDPAHLFLAASSHDSASASMLPNTSSSSYLQTYDSIRNVHISRQALARTNATSTNLGPERNKLHEASIEHLAVTSNGQWLATVDDWRPPAKDFQDLAGEPSELEDEASKHYEVCLRIWRRNERDENWMLNTSLPSPHESLPGTEGKIARALGLAVSPTKTLFATLGEDRTVRIWSPRTRRRDGKIVLGTPADSTTAQTWWALRHIIPLEGNSIDEPLSPAAPTEAMLAWSDDGSLIAAWMGFPGQVQQPPRLPAKASESNSMAVERYDGAPEPHGQDAIHLIDADVGMLKETRTDILGSSSSSSGNLQDLAFADRYLLVLTRTALHTLDLPLSVHLPTIQVPNLVDAAPAPQLAVNHNTNTLAISVPVLKRRRTMDDPRGFPQHAHRDYTSRVFLYPLPTFHSSDEAPKSAQKPLLDAVLPHLALKVLSASGNVLPIDSFDTVPSKATSTEASSALRKGYVVIDSNATIRRIQPPMLSETLARAMAEDQAEAGEMELDDETSLEQQSPNRPLFDRQAATVRRSAQEIDGDVQPIRRQQPRVVPGQKLAEAIGQGPILGRSSQDGSNSVQSAGGALPSVREMFNNVVGLFWGKGDDAS